ILDKTDRRPQCFVACGQGSSMAFIDQVGTLDEDEAGPRYLRLQKLLRVAIDNRRLPVGSPCPASANWARSMPSLA
ncbi:hypothetical protein, partial [Enterococcus casseliflavus]|uniref:hypothetical protein n=1 Tax=Enterococcus casseliflavus TaxID=37734 RepID=UPI003D12151F